MTEFRFGQIKRDDSERAPQERSLVELTYRKKLRCAILSMLFITAVAPHTFGQNAAQYRITQPTRDGLVIRQAFKPVVNNSNRSTVEIVCNQKQVALGTVVDKAGLIVTKASELSGPITARFPFPRRISLAADIVFTDRTNDLALLKVEANDLTPVSWSSDSKVSAGQWVVTTGLVETPLAIGVLSVGRRKIPSQPQTIGVGIRNETEGARVIHLFPNSGAAAAGVRVGDIITHVGNQRVMSGEALSKSIQSKRSGETVLLKVSRRNQQLSLHAKVKPRSNFTSPRSHEQNEMGSELSQRRSGFPTVLQHDTVISPEQCGGPLLDLTGQTVAINIARAGRTATFALPADVVQSFLQNALAAMPPAENAQPANSEPTPNS